MANFSFVLELFEPLPCGLFSAKVIGDGAAQDAIEPGDDAFVVAQAVAALKGTQEAGLQEVVGFVLAADLACEKAVEPGALRDERGDGGLGERDGARAGRWHDVAVDAFTNPPAQQTLGKIRRSV